MPQELGQFCKKYHKAFVQAVGDDVEKAKSKIASSWIDDWRKELGGPIEDGDEFRERFQGFLEDELGFAGRADVSVDHSGMTIDVEECAICPGNDLLRAEGRQALCPIVATGLFAASRVHNRRATLEGVDKSRTGYCKIRYSLADKAS